jgi:hypothetical protein
MTPHRSRNTLAQELAIPHTPLLPQCRTFLLLNEAIKLALNTLEAASLAVRELPIESVADLLPHLTQINAMVPDEVHFLFLVLWTWVTAAAAVSGGA